MFKSNPFGAKLLLFILLNFNPISFYAQSKINCDTIQNELKDLRLSLNRIKAIEGKSKVDSLKKLTLNECDNAKIEFDIISGRWKEFDKEFDEALTYYDKALEKSQNNSYYQKTIAGYKVEIFGKKLDNEKALEIANEAINIPCPNEDYDCNRSTALLIFKSAIRLQMLDKPAKAVERYESLEREILANNLNEPILKAGLYNQLGSIYFKRYQDSKGALDYFKKSLAITPANNKNKFFLYNNIAGCYSNLQNTDSTKYYYQRIMDETEDSQFLNYAYGGLGAMYDDLNNYPQAIEYFTLGLNNAIKDKNKGSELIAKINLGKMHFLNGQGEKANFYLSQVVDSELFPKITGERRYQANLYSYLSEINLTKPDLSYKLYEVFQKYDTLAIERKTAEINKSVSKYEKLILRDSLEKQILIKENEEQKVKNYRLSTGLLLMSIFFLAWLVFQFRNLFSKQKEANEELVFQNNELQKLNEQLEQKTMTLSAIPKVDTETKEVNIKTKDKTYFVPTDSITYVQAEDDGTRVYYDNISKWTDVSLKNFQEQIGETYFVQIARGVVVNVKHIAWINTNTLKMKAGAELKIGRTYKPKIKQILES